MSGRFLDLYDTCRPAIFQADFRRVYGVGFQVMEGACWREMRSAGEPRE